MLLCTCASASSLFTLPSAAEVESAPSYVAMTGVLPVSETTQPDGGVMQVYSPVGDAEYLAFGTLLAEEGYAVESQNVTDGIVEVVVFKDNIHFTVSYDQAGQQLKTLYPAGIVVRAPELPDPFDGYIEIQFGETVRIKDASGGNMGDVTIKAAHVNEPITYYGKHYTGGRWDFGTFYIWFEGTLKNVSGSYIYLKDAYNVTLHYVNSDNHYTFSADVKDDIDVGSLYNGNDIFFASDTSRSSYSTKWSGHTCSSLSEVTIASGFVVPETVCTSTDGILALTFEFSGLDTPYVLYIRRPS